jgi:hypothetical protein
MVPSTRANILGGKNSTTPGRRPYEFDVRCLIGYDLKKVGLDAPPVDEEPKKSARMHPRHPRRWPCPVSYQLLMILEWTLLGKRGVLV